jgi:hypothetical protein
VSVKSFCDMVIGYAASACVVIGAIDTELGGNHQVALACSVALAVLHHAMPILEQIAAKAPPAAPAPPADKH